MSFTQLKDACDIDSVKYKLAGTLSVFADVYNWTIIEY